jgi:hypothetical protein
VHIDISRGNGQPVSIDGFFGGKFRQVSYRDNGISFDSNVAMKPGIPCPINDLSIRDKNIKFFSLRFRTRNERENKEH